MDIVVITVILLLLILLICHTAKSDKKLRYFMLYVISGLGMFVILSIAGNYYESVKLSLNWFNLSVSAVGGVPGVLFLLALKFLL